MRRPLLILTAVSISAWAQPASAPAQPPIVVQVQMPPTNPSNPWTPLWNLAPGIITSSSALAVLWFTLRYQRRLEIQKAQVAAEYRSRDNRWEFRKEVYVNLITSLTGLITEYRLALEHIPHDEERLRASYREFTLRMNLASLVGMNNVSALTQETLPEILNSQTDQPTDEQVQVLVRFRLRLCDEGRKDLWGESESAANSDGSQ